VLYGSYLHAFIGRLVFKQYWEIQLSETTAPINRKDKTLSIKKAILDSGFPTEIEVSEILRADDWLAVNQAPYFDSQKNDFQFIDIFALKQNVGLIIECKKSLKGHPWVFLTQSRSDLWVTAASVIHLIQGFSDQNKLRYPPNSHWLNPSIRVGTIFIAALDKIEDERGKKRENSFLTALKQIQSEMIHFFGPKFFPIYPIVVYDGEIYEFTNKEIDLKPLDYLQYIHAQLKGNVVWPFLVDIVNIHYFPEFLKMIDKEFTSKQSFDA
jgi:hypothetical protein